MWTYDETDLTTTTATGRLNSVRLLVGDADTTDQLLADAEIRFALSEANNNVYYAAAWACKVLAAKFARMVNTQLDGALEATYSDRIKHYNLLSGQLSGLGKQTSGKSLGISAGGISIAAIDLAEANTDRPASRFTITQFDYEVS